MATCFNLCKIHVYIFDLAKVEKKQKFIEFGISDLNVMIHVAFNTVLLNAILIR